MLLAILLLVPLSVFGEEGDFSPTIYSTQGDFELNMMHQNDENTSGGKGTRSSDTFSYERLLLSLDGYVYHPRFIQFLIKGAGGLSQERYNNNQIGSFSDNSFSRDYEFRAKILPEHPYNLEIYTLSTTPIAQMSSAEIRPTGTSTGAIFDYANKPLFFNMKHNTGDTKTRISSSEYRTNTVNVSHITGPFNNSAAFSQTDSSTSLGTHAGNNLSFFSNTIRTGALSLDSKLTERHSKQSSPFTASLDTDTFEWTEQFNAELPWNFSTSAFYNLLKNSMITEKTAVQPQLKEHTDTEGAGFALAHKLYDSVRTVYSMSRTSSDTSTGNTMNLMHSLNGIYTKRVPDGRLTIGVQGSRSLVDRENAPLIIMESYSAHLFRSFTIMREGLDPGTISIRVLADDGSLVDLEQNIHYIMEFFGNSVTVTILLLPPQISSGHPLGYPYTFYVRYTLFASTVVLETTTAGYNLNLTLFHNLISPYYSRYHTEQAVLEGYIPGGAQEGVTTVIGNTIQKAPYSLMIEERTVESNTSPSRSLRNAVQYAKRMSSTLNLSAKAEHLKTIYGTGTAGSTAFTEQMSNFNVMITKNVPRRKLIATATATYSKRHATITTDLYALTGNLNWKFGELSVNSGVTINRAESTGTSEKQAMLSEFFYLTVSRRLF